MSSELYVIYVKHMIAGLQVIKKSLDALCNFFWEM